MMTSIPLHIFRNAKSIALAAGICASVLTSTPSQAQFTEFDETTEAAFNALGVTAVPITGTPPQTYQTYTTTVGTQTLTFTNNGNGTTQYIERRNQQGPGNVNNNYGGDFPNGTPLLRNVVSAAVSNVADGLVITFSSPISAFGLNFDPTLVPAPTDFTFSVFEGGINPAGSFARPGEVNGGAGDGSAPFFGVQEAGGNLITSIRIVGAPSPGGSPVNTTPNDFAVGLLRFYIAPIAPPPSVPEPGSLALLMGMAATGAGCFARRKRVAANK